MVPLMVMILRREQRRARLLLYFPHFFEEIIYREELEKPAAHDGSLQDFHALPCSRPDGWNGYGRCIDAEMLAEVAPSPDERPLAFVCGPTPLVEAMGAALVHLGHDPARVKAERFKATGG